MARKTPVQPAPAKRQAKAPATPASNVKDDTAQSTTPSPVSASADGVTTQWSPATGEAGIRVRMYRVGFGDFFLITCLHDGAEYHIIVDCGVFKGTTQTGDIGSIGAAVADMVQTTGGQVALIIMTHRHADHIAGFARYPDTFKKLTVGAVWMPIWESEYEPTALKFQAQLTKTAFGLQQHFSALGATASEEQDTARKFMENATGLGVAGATGTAAAGSNEVALDLLKHGFKGVVPSYYKSGDTAQLPPVLVAAGLSAQILGPPPVSDLDLMKLMDLQKNVGQYLAGDGNDGNEDAEKLAPFGIEWEVDPAQEPEPGQHESYANESFREWVDPRKYWEHVSVTEARRARDKMISGLQQSQPVAALTAAKQLNSFPQQSEPRGPVHI